jgi:exopolysaccharide biosynthesis polyprenyl glycosylphosphotransferase
MTQAARTRHVADPAGPVRPAPVESSAGELFRGAFRGLGGSRTAGHGWQAQFWRWSQLCACLAALGIAFIATNADQVAHEATEFLALRISVSNLLMIMVLLAIWSWLFTQFGLNQPTRSQQLRNEGVRLFAACVAGSIPLVLIVLKSQTGAFQWVTLGYFFLGALTLTALTRGMLRGLGTVAPTRQAHRVLIVGSGPRADRLHDAVTSDPDHGAHVVGFVDVEAKTSQSGGKLLGRLEDLESLLMFAVVDEVLIALPCRSMYQQIQEAIFACERVGVPVTYLADVFQHSMAQPRYGAAGTVPVVQAPGAADDPRQVVKRLIDILGASAGLLVLSPLLLAAAVMIKLTSRGPVIFAQDRYGYNKRLFKMYKFRTMVADAEALQAALEDRNEAAGPVFKIAQDPRVTPVGHLLRRTSIDELPQLINVLIGNMALVGPRPLPTRDVQKFSEPWLMRRFSVRPGCTGLWQVSGRSRLGFDQWVAMDLQYIDDWSLWLDLQILCRTPFVVMKQDGAL